MRPKGQTDIYGLLPGAFTEGMASDRRMWGSPAFGQRSEGTGILRTMTMLRNAWAKRLLAYKRPQLPFYLSRDFLYNYRRVGSVEQSMNSLQQASKIWRTFNGGGPSFGAWQVWQLLYILEGRLTIMIDASGHKSLQNNCTFRRGLDMR